MSVRCHDVRVVHSRVRPTPPKGGHWRIHKGGHTKGRKEGDEVQFVGAPWNNFTDADAVAWAVVDVEGGGEGEGGAVPKENGRASTGLALRFGFREGEGRLERPVPSSGSTEGGRGAAPFFDLDRPPPPPLVGRTDLAVDAAAVELASPPLVPRGCWRGSPTDGPLVGRAPRDPSLPSPVVFLTFPLLLLFFSCFFRKYSINGVTTTVGLASDGASRSATDAVPVLDNVACSSSRRWRNSW